MDPFHSICVRCGKEVPIAVTVTLLGERVSFCSHACVEALAGRLLTLAMAPTVTMKEAPAKSKKTSA